MSTAWAGGSTRGWRKLRLKVLERDRHTCQVPVDDEGTICGRPATTVGHLDPLRDGHPKMAHSSRLRAECTMHNYGDGQAITADILRRRQRTWSW